MLCRAYRKMEAEHRHFQDLLKIKRETLKEDLGEVSKAPLGKSRIAAEAHSTRPPHGLGLGPLLERLPCQRLL